MCCQTVLHDVVGVQDILALSENPLDAFSPGRPCLVVQLAPADKTSSGREKIVEAIRSRLAPVAEATVRAAPLVGSGRFSRRRLPGQNGH